MESCRVPSGSISAVSYTHLDVYKRQLLADPLFDRPDGATLRPSIERLTALFIGRQYGRAEGATGAAEARDLWGHLGGSLRRLALRHRFQPGQEAKRDTENTETEHSEHGGKRSS